MVISPKVKLNYYKHSEMVKAYLRYVQQSVLSALVGNLSVVKILKFGGSTYLVTACNEVVSLSNLKTGEIEH